CAPVRKRCTPSAVCAPTRAAPSRPRRSSSSAPATAPSSHSPTAPCNTVRPSSRCRRSRSGSRTERWSLGEGVRRVRLQELVDLQIVHPGKPSRGQRGQNLGVCGCAGPGRLLPPVAQLLGGTSAAAFVRAGGGVPTAGLTSAEVFRLGERHTDGDGELATVGAAGLGGAPEGGLIGIGVLVEVGGAGPAVERCPGGPPAAHVLALDGAGDVHRQRYVVVLVPLVQRAVVTHAQIVHSHVQ